MKRMFIAAVFGGGMFFALQYFKPDFATTLVTLGGTQVAWGWILIGATFALGLIVSGKK